MKKIITISCFTLSFMAFFAIVGSQTACQKQSTDCPCVITVKDSNNNPVTGATVKLYAPNGTLTHSSATTNAAGNVNFDFSLPAIYNILAYKGLALNDTLKGSGIIQLQIGQSVSTTVTIK